MSARESTGQVLERDIESACAESARYARHEVIDQLHGVFRRLRLYGSESEWVSAVLDGASAFAGEAALFIHEKAIVKLRGERNIELPQGFAFPLASARAFAAAVESRDPVVALRSDSELGEVLGNSGAPSRVHLFPITNGARVAAVLFAAGVNAASVNALELISTMASAVIERQANSSLHSQIAPAADAATASSGAKQAERDRLPWRMQNPSIEDAEQRALHVRARRFSRVAIAKIQLARPAACRTGRQQNNLYVFLREDLDQARDKFRRQFMIGPSMVDYLHLELVRAVAEGDETKLGAEYPGQLE